jgi:hypothetical protein
MIYFNSSINFIIRKKGKQESMIRAIQQGQGLNRSLTRIVLEFPLIGTAFGPLNDNSRVWIVSEKYQSLDNKTKD